MLVDQPDEVNHGISFSYDSAEGDALRTTVHQRLLSSIYPSPENDLLYNKPADASDAAFVELVESVREEGVKVPLAITLDDFILATDT